MTLWSQVKMYVKNLHIRYKSSKPLPVDFEGEVGGDQQPPGDTCRHPTAPPKFFSVTFF